MKLTITLLIAALAAHAQSPQPNPAQQKRLVAAKAIVDKVSPDQPAAKEEPDAAIEKEFLQALITMRTQEVIVEHSTDNATWSALITFAQTTATGAQRVAATGTIDRYVRVSTTTVAGYSSITIGVAFVRTTVATVF